MKMAELSNPIWGTYKAVGIADKQNWGGRVAIINPWINRMKRV
jgi:hypothetical protein